MDIARINFFQHPGIQLISGQYYPLPPPPISNNIEIFLQSFNIDVHTDVATFTDSKRGQQYEKYILFTIYF